MQNYYRGTFYGKSTASIMYELGIQLNKEGKDMLWWRIVGLTDQILHKKIDIEEKNYEIVSCNKEVSRLVPYDDLNVNPIEEEEEKKSEELPDQVDLFKKVELVSENRQVGHIRSEPELKFMLLRHWTLFDSINNSNYMVAKLGLWREPGKKELRDFFAHLGCSLDQAK